MFYWIGFTLFWIVYKFLFRFQIRGGAHIPPRGGVIIASNHASFWDPPLVAVSVGMVRKRGVYFLAKEELFRFTVFRYILKKVLAIPLKRDKGLGPGAFRHALKILEQGKVLLVFPQGTRIKGGRVGRAKPGISMLLEKSSVPVVPVFLKNTEHSGRFLRFIVRFGPALKLEQNGEKGDYQKTAQKILEEIFCLGKGIQET